MFDLCSGRVDFICKEGETRVKLKIEHATFCIENNCRVFCRNLNLFSTAASEGAVAAVGAVGCSEQNKGGD